MKKTVNEFTYYIFRVNCVKFVIWEKDKASGKI